MVRSVLLLFALLAVALAGCLDGDANDLPPGNPSSQTPEGGEDTTPRKTVSRNASEPTESQAPFAFPEDYPTFCGEDDSSSDLDGVCDFNDDIFHNVAIYEVDTTKIDVLIVPPASPEAQRDIVTLRAAVEAWRDGIYELGEPWFLERFEVNVYVLGEDTPPQDALDDPEIVVLGAEFNPVLLFGIGFEPNQFSGVEVTPCRNGGDAVHTYPVHSHHGMSIYAAECEEGGFTCVAANTNFAWPTGTERTMYDLVAHEVGHCLGTGHVGDALDFAAKRIPIQDIMSYQSNPDQVHCVSNLNVRSLEGIYAPLFETVPAHVTFHPVFEYIHMHPADYVQVECANPDVTSLLP